MKNFLFIITLLFCFNTWAVVTPGKIAPDFSLKGHDGKTYKLSEQQGKFVILEWTNNECPFVKKHYESKNMQAIQKMAKAEGIVWWSIISSAPGKQGHLDANGATEIYKQTDSQASAVLLDPQGLVGNSYEAKTTPHMYVISKEGKLLYAGAIDDTPSTNQDDIKKSKNFIVEIIDQVKNNKKNNKTIKPTSNRAYGCGIKY